MVKISSTSSDCIMIKYLSEIYEKKLAILNKD